MNIVLDNRSSGIYEHYEYGAAMFGLDVRSDTGAINQTPVATLPGEFLMQANCKNSYKFFGNFYLPIIHIMLDFNPSQ